MSNENIFPNPLQPEPWLRLWLPERAWEHQGSMDDDFLSDIGAPGDTDHLFAEAPSGISCLASFADVPFLLLLGRPGAGKSQEVSAAARLGWLGDSILIEAKEIGTELPGDFIQSLLSTTAHESPVRIIIDGLDEVLLQNPNFVPQLRGWLRRQAGQNGRPIHRLAISCRWADRDIAGVEELASLWANEDSQTLVLCPLRRTDVVATLKRRFGDKADNFWRQMHEHHLVSIACWPQSCLGLMQSFENSDCKQIATSHADAVRDQILNHCRLTDSLDDRLRWEESVADAEWRQRVAGRLSAAMIWSGRSSFEFQFGSTNPDQKAITLSELSTTEELRDGKRVAVTLADVDGVARRTRLLRQMADGKCWVFQSQVHQEWLAADWLAAHKLDEKRLQQLFGARQEGHWKVFPALRSVAAWLARFDPLFRHLLLEHDPLVLLRLDAASLPMSEREDIIEALLVATNEIRVVDPGVRHAHLLSLNHPKLEAQLTRWLSRDDVCDAVKELAVEIVAKTQLVGIAPLLWRVFASTKGGLQNEIAGTLYHIAKNGFDEQWKAVINDQIHPDDYGEIMGAAIDIMVISGKRMPLRDILHCLIPTRRFKAYGLYSMFARNAHEQMTVDDLPDVFAKLAEKPTRIHDSLNHAQDLNKTAVRLAIQNFDRPEVAAALTNYWHLCVKHYAHPHHDYNSGWTPEELGFTSDEQRRRIIRQLLVHPAFEARADRTWIDVSDYLIMERDLEWCLDELISTDQESEWRFALAVTQFIRRAEHSEFLAAKIKAAWAKSTKLREFLPKPQKGETIIDALTREKERSSFKREREDSVRGRKQAKDEAVRKLRLEEYTQRCMKAHMAGKLSWPGVTRVLAARCKGQATYCEEYKFVSAIKDDEAWMHDAALRFLVEFPDKEPITDDHGSTGLLALAVCARELDHSAPLQTAISQHWLRVFIGTPATSWLGTPPEGVSDQNLARLYPAEFAEALGEDLRKRYLGKSGLGELRSMRDFWTPAMTKELSAILREEEIQPEGFANGVRHLAAVSEDEAVALVREWLRKTEPPISTQAKAVLLSAGAAMLNGRLAAEVRPFLDDAELVREAIFASIDHLSFTERNIDYSLWPDHSIKELADAAWRAYPKMEGHKSSGRGFGGVTGEDLAIDFRDAITSAARQRGIEVVIPLVHSSDSEEETRDRLHLVNWNRHIAAQARAGSAWQSLEPEQFFKIANRPHARLARDNDEIMEAIIECLRRWEQSLAAGAWDHLWDVSSKTSRPELRIADEMRNWLNDELDVVVECEATLSSKARTDILVQTLPGDTALPKLSVVIELKKLRKSNAKERRIAMKTQLLDRYLNERQHEGWTHGLYVIAWTPVPGSKEDDPGAISEAEQSLAAQAVALSKPPFVLSSMVVDARYRATKAATRQRKVSSPGRA